MKTVRWIAAASVAVGMTLLAPTASAEPTGSHCYTNVGTAVTECFDSLAAAEAAGAKSSIMAVPAVRFFSLTEFTGNSHTVFLPRECTTSKAGDPEGHVSDMGLLTPPPGLPPRYWNDQVRSFVALSNCKVNFFWDRAFQGPSTGYLLRDGNMDTGLGLLWNDEASSLWLS